MIIRLIFLLLLSCANLFARAGPYDGDWWRTAPKDERIGFLAGYFDCEIYDAGRKDLAAGASVYTLEPHLTRYYETHVEERKRLVPSLLLEVASRERKPKTAPNGQRYPGKHGFYDGEYWREGVPAHRLGFVEGYLDCQRREGTPPGMFSHDAAWYVARISQWYGVNAEDPSQINPRRANTKVADVLYALRDHPPKAGTSAYTQEH